MFLEFLTDYMIKNSNYTLQHKYKQTLIISWQENLYCVDIRHLEKYNKLYDTMKFDNIESLNKFIATYYIANGYTLENDDGMGVSII